MAIFLVGGRNASALIRTDQDRPLLVKTVVIKLDCLMDKGSWVTWVVGSNSKSERGSNCDQANTIKLVFVVRGSLFASRSWTVTTIQHIIYYTRWLNLIGCPFGSLLRLVAVPSEEGVIGSRTSDNSEVLPPTRKTATILQSRLYIA